MTLIQKGNKLDVSMGNAISWLKKSNSVDTRTIKSLNETRRSVSKMTKSLGNKNVFTVFGASQVGKSYLVKNILSVDNKPLNIDLGNGDLVDFIKDINPHGGGKESTGIVSRFTIDKVKNLDFPVELKLLSVKDLILIFSRSAFDNIQNWSPVSRDEMLSSLNHLSETEWETSNCKIPLTSFEVDEIFDSLESEFKQYRSFWNDLEELNYIKYIEENLDSICSSIEYFDAVFNIIWKNSNHLNTLFKELLELYREINFESNVYVKKRAILNDVINDKGDGLLDASCVTKKGDDKKLEIFLSESNLSKNVSKKGLSSISKEIVLNIEERIAETREFLKRTDFMDFPGARSNKDINADSDLEKSDSTLTPGDIYLRGKVSYLFDRYSEDFEINNLLFCIPSQKNEVTSLPGLLSSWINRNVGSTPVEREKSLMDMKTSPLMIVFTWWNVELKPYPSDNQGFEHKWDKRFDKFFEEEMVSDHIWFKQWSETKPKFSEFYFLRDFNESHPQSRHGGGIFHGYDEMTGSPETGYVTKMPNTFEKFSSPTNYMNEIKSSFLAYPFVRENINNPEEVWNATSTPGNDGSELIAKTLFDSSHFSPKERRAEHLFSTSKSAFIDILKDIVRDDDPAIRLREIKALIQEIRAVFLPHIQRKSSFIHEFQNFLSTDLSEVYPIVNQHTKVEQTNGDGDVTIFLKLYDFINLEMPLSTIISKLSNYLGIPQENVESYILENHRINLKLLCQSDLKNDDSSWVVNVVMELADKKFERAEKLDYLVKNGIDHQLLVRLFDQYKDGIINRKLSNKLESQIATVDNIMIGSDDLEWMANLICKWWNEFVFECDSRFYTDDEKEQLNSIEAGHYKISKFTEEIVDDKTAFAKITELFGTNQMSDIQTITSLPGIFKLKEWLHNLERMMILNAGGDAFDQDDQAELVQIYDSLRKIDIPIV